MCRHLQQEQDQQVQTFTAGKGPHVQTFTVETGPARVDIYSRNRTNTCRHLQQEQDQHCRHLQQKQDQHVLTFTVETGPARGDIYSWNRTSTCRHLQKEQDQHVQTFAVGNLMVKGTFCRLTKKTIQQIFSRLSLDTFHNILNI